MKTKIVQMPYGREFLYIRIPAKNFQKIYTFKEPLGLKDEKKEIEISLRSPIKKHSLSSIIDSKDRVSILISDITRPVPSNKIVPAILNSLEDIPGKNIIGVIATGLHRSNTKQELKTMLGHDVLKKIKVVNHDAFDKEKLAYVGNTSRGTELEINKLVRNSDKIIATGYIEPHEFAGFTGGRKSILPGVSGSNAINYNHRLENLDHPKAKIGILEGNPIHEDMVEAAKMANVDFIVNVVLNSKKEITKVVAGDMIKAHQEGISFYKKYAQVRIDEPTDIIVTSSGFPLDINFYQAVKSIIAAEPFVVEGGTIILLAKCEKGFGGDMFYKWMTSFSSPADIIKKIQRKGYRADIDHCYLLARILEKKDIIVVSKQQSLQDIKDSLLKVTSSIEKAISYTLNKKGKNSKIAFLPYATHFVPKF